jgi:hypothetical protein
MESVYSIGLKDVDVHTSGQVTSDIDVRPLVGLTVDCNLKTLVGGTAPTVQFCIDRKHEYKDNTGQTITTWVQIDSPAAISVVSTPPTGLVSIPIGPGMTNAVPTGRIIRVRWIVTGAPSSATADILIQGEGEY